MNIVGLAIPYGVPNSYAETFTPTTLDKRFMAQLKILPMLLDHDRKHIVGFWHKFSETPQGLYAAGRVLDPEMIKVIERTPNAKRGLSVTYGSPDAARDERLNRMKSLFSGRQVFDPVTVEDAILSEISLTDSPAWKQCFYEVLP